MILDVIIPTKNRSEMIAKQMDIFSKVLAEEGSGLRVSIIDDNSDKIHKRKISSLSKTTASVEIVYSKTSIGAAKARNIGAELNPLVSVNNWLWFIDDDDFVDAQSIRTVLAILKQGVPNYSVALLPCKSDNELVVPKCTNLFERYRKFGQDVNTSCLIVRRELFFQVGKWDEKLVAGQDTDLFLRISQVENKALLMDKCLVVREMNSSNRITRSAFRQMKGKYQFIRKHWKTISKIRLIRYIATFYFVFLI